MMPEKPFMKPSPARPVPPIAMPKLGINQRTPLFLAIRPILR